MQTDTIFLFSLLIPSKELFSIFFKFDYIFDSSITKSPTGKAITVCVNIPITAYFM